MGIVKIVFALAFSFLYTINAAAQVPPSAAEIAEYKGVFAAVVQNDIPALEAAIKQTDNIDARDNYHRTALHVAAFFGNHEAMRLLVKAGADPNALEHDRYDMVTITAVANDLETMKLALQLGNRADLVTSRYDGTALIAAAHLGHAEVVKTLIDAGAPLDHVNNLRWTALIESIVLGDGGPNHVATLKALVDAGADITIADGSGTSPLELARQHGYAEMVEILENAAAK